MMTWPSAVTTSTASRLSTVMPYLPISQPSPPPRVRPAIPVLETTPPVVAGRGPVELFPGHPALRPYRPPRRVDPDPFHRRQVDHQAAVGDAQASHVAASAAHRYLARLLAAELLVNANQMVLAVRLIDELWGADLPADPRAALRTQVARLRRALGPAGGDLATLEGGYRLTVPRGGLDVCQFEDALGEAALGELADRPFALATAARLDELRVAAAERQAELQLSLGRAEEAAAALRALLAEHPEREQARGLLMQALYRAGRHTEALAAARSWRRHLATELGLDPSPALQAIEQDILRPRRGRRIPAVRPRRCRCR
jgi:DNA-binding SARP family transcriptional activator